MARMTKRQRDEYVEVFYGINPKTYEVESVYLTRGGVLSKSARDGSSYSHPIHPSSSPRNEIIIVWHLTDLISYRLGIFTQDQIREGVEKLEALAAEKKADAEVKKATTKKE